MGSPVERTSGDSVFKIRRDPSVGGMSNSGHRGRFTRAGLQEALIEAQVAGVPDDCPMWFINNNEYLEFKYDGEGNDYKPKTAPATKASDKLMYNFPEFIAACAGVSALVGFFVGRTS